jgi:hypothetical protein
MTRCTSVILLLSTLLVISGCAAKKPVSPTQAITLCGQTTMSGGPTPDKKYDSEQACIDDRPNLQDAAATDGTTKCTNYCTGLGTDCTPQPAPKPPKKTVACTKQDDNKWHSHGETGTFDCICKKP